MSSWLLIAAIAMLMLSLVSPPLFAADPAALGTNSSPGLDLTLNKARELAFANNWDLLAIQTDVDQATAQRIIAKEFPNPILGLSTTKINADSHPAATFGRNDVWSRNYDTIAVINQLFEIGGKRKYRQASARAGLETARARLLDAKRLLDLAVSKAFISALLTQSNVETLRKSAASLRKEADIAETRQKAGDISATDKAQIEIIASRFELDALTAETSAATQLVALQTLLGISMPSMRVTLSDSLDQLAEMRVPIFDPANLPARSDLVAAEAALKKAEADISVQKALRVPDPTVFVQYEHEPADQPNSVGFGVSFPLPLWNHNRGGILGAKANAEQARFLVAKTKAGISSEIAAAQLTYQDAYQRWNRYRSDIGVRSGQQRTAISYAYGKGGVSLLDLLLAERTDNEIRLATTQAAADTATAAATLNTAIYPTKGDERIHDEKKK